MAFFDGQNLYRHAMDAFGHHHPNYDPVKLHKAVCARNGWIPNLVRFYTGVPDPKESPMWAAYWSNRVLALTRAGVVVTTRPIRYHKEKVVGSDGEERVVTTPQEKGIDVRLALDLVARARKREFHVAVIYSQDQDLCEVVQEVKEIAKEQGRWI
ncbi:MAG: NYN domain-containing protein, partial [Rhodoplanes sp.]